MVKYQFMFNLVVNSWFIINYHMDGHGPHMSAHGSYIDEHGPHVGI